MSIAFSDNFNRADGGLGANWTNIGASNFAISSNIANSGGSTSQTAAYPNTAPGGANCWAEIKFSTLPPGSDLAYLVIRYATTGGGQGYLARVDGTDLRLQVLSGGSPTLLGSALSLPSTGQALRLEMRGSDLSYYVNDTLTATRSDGTITGAGDTLMSLISNSAGFDDFAHGLLPTISSPTPSGTLGTDTTATIGCTTDDSTGTLYVVVDTASLSGITASQIKAGQNASSAAADASGNSSVSGSSPSVGVTGLTASTAYNYAVLQFSGGNSNVLTGTFTTGTGGGGTPSLLISGGKIISSGGKLLRFG